MIAVDQAAAGCPRARLPARPRSGSSCPRVSRASQHLFSWDVKERNMTAMGTSIQRHRPVLLREAVSFLRPNEGGVYVDATVGDGGHAGEILRQMGPRGRVVGIDWDGDALDRARTALSDFGERVTLVRDNFRNMPSILRELNIRAVDGILLDLGMSSDQIEDAERGFSFLRPGPLDMRMDRRRGRTAAEIVNTERADSIERILKEFGEERWAGRIALAIERRRRTQPIDTTADLAGIVRGAVPARYRSGRIDPATRPFQALRIAVNEEMENLHECLEGAVDLLAPGGRLVVIAFHSLEDRAVKEFFRREEKGCICPPALPVCACGRRPRLTVIVRTPVTPEETEASANPRSRSAKLRAAERL